MSKVLNWAVVGCGVISKNHLDAVAAIDNARVYAVCDIIEERAKKRQEEYGAEKVYTDYHELMEDPQVDVVSVCTPSGAHAEIAVAAARHHKHIFCEKPLEVTSEKISQIIDAAQENNVKLGCVFQRRTYPEAVAVREFLEQHDVGPVIYAEAKLKYWRSQEYYDSGEWRATWDMDGGGALMNQGVHGIDLLLWFVGNPKAVYAVCKTQSHDIPVEDASAAVVEFENGAIGVIRGTTCVYPGEATEIALHFKTGTIIFGDKGIVTCEFQDESLKMPPLKPFVANIKEDPTQIGALSHVVLAQDLVDSILNDRAPCIPPEDARRAVDLILSIYRSSNEQRRIEL